MSSPRRGILGSRLRRLIAVLAGLLVLGIAAVAFVYFYDRGQTGSVYHPHARFEAQSTPPPVKPTKRREEHFYWHFYGYTKSHTRFFPADARVRPPFKRLWLHQGNSLLEFPPTIANKRIFQLADNGILSAISRQTGKDLWWTQIGALTASTPAVVGNRLYATVLDRRKGLEAGRIVCLDVATGKTIWSRDLPSQSESSPLVDKGKVFFGTQNGTVYALKASNGNRVWTYHAGGSVKASPSLLHGVLYFGDYSGHVQAVSERTGKALWVKGSDGALLGSGTFYSTAALRYGRVYLGNTDGRVYAYDQRNGNLDWAVQTGAYVYSSPAVTNAPGIGPTIFIGSYDGYFYALNARTGKLDWRFNGHGRISGSPTIIGHVVYFADLGTHSSYGLGLATGHVVFHMDTGSFDPVISDGRDIYLSGYSSLFDLQPLDEIHRPRDSGTSASAKHTSARAKHGSASAKHASSTAKHGSAPAKHGGGHAKQAGHRRRHQHKGG